MSDVKRTALADLIDATEERNGWQDTDVARQAVERGQRLTKSDVSNYRRTGMPTLVPAKMAALASGLRVPTYVVAVAVLSDHDIDVPLDDTTPEQAIERDFSLPAADRDNVLLLLQAARDRANPRPQRRRGKPRDGGQL